MEVREGHAARRPAKRSGRVRLSTMAATAGALAGSALLAGCGEAGSPTPQAVAAVRPAGTSEVQAFGNVFECAANSTLSQEECVEARKQAVAASEEIAPRYAGQGDCEEEWGAGNCVTQTGSGRSFFSPFVTGFLLGKLTGGRQDYLPLYRKGTDGGYVTAGGSKLAFAGAPGKYLAEPRALQRPRTVGTIKADSGAAARGGLTWGANADEDEDGNDGSRRRTSSRSSGG
jgi:uncharacterized protein YgiB involved in biofilm formation